MEIGILDQYRRDGEAVRNLIVLALLYTPTRSFGLSPQLKRVIFLLVGTSTLHQLYNSLKPSFQPIDKIPSWAEDEETEIVAKSIPLALTRIQTTGATSAAMGGKLELLN